MALFNDEEKAEQGTGDNRGRRKTQAESANGPLGENLIALALVLALQCLVGILKGAGRVQSAQNREPPRALGKVRLFRARDRALIVGVSGLIPTEPAERGRPVAVQPAQIGT